jgi:hypothetical protein
MKRHDGGGSLRRFNYFRLLGRTICLSLKQPLVRLGVEGDRLSLLKRTSGLAIMRPSLTTIGMLRSDIPVFSRQIELYITVVQKGDMFSSKKTRFHS